MIVQLGYRDAPALIAHITRHAAESGRDGDVIFRPRPATDPIDGPATIERHRSGWAQPLDVAHWVRSWGVVIDRDIRGHLDLYGGRLPAELHRATVGMGIERVARNQGYGRALLDTAIAWARASGLAWLDLGVFAHNERARKLYRAAGFVEVGTTRDRFRVEGIRIDDIAMTLSL